MRFGPVARGATIVLAFSASFVAFPSFAQQSHQRTHKELLKIVELRAHEAGIPANLVRAVIRMESEWNQKLTGSAGEIGLMQLRYETAREMGYGGTKGALYDAETNIRWGVKYLAGAYKLAHGDLCQTSLKYLAGHEISKMTSAARSYCSHVRTYMAAK
jgi:soluble lytic murein transglycosylase-like protein